MARDLRRFKEMEYAVGTDGTITIALKDSAGADLAIVGASAQWDVYLAVPRRRAKPFTGNVVLQKTSAAGQIALTLGQAVITISSDSDFDGKQGRFHQILRITDSSGNVTHLGMGELFLVGAPT